MCQAACLVAVLALSGCQPTDVGFIHGAVTLDGEPVETGAIAFFPTDGKSFTSGAAIDAGAYDARVPLGELRVEIRVPRQTGEQKLYDVPDSPTMPILEEQLPPRYNNRSELRIVVEPGRSQHDFKLSAE